MTKIISFNKSLLSGLYISIAVAILVTAMLAISPKKISQPKVVLGNVEVFVEIADTVDLRAKGLSGHKKLGTNEGMFFIFPEPGQHGFWMRDMLFPIDIIWLDSMYRIVDVSKNATPESYPKIFVPRAFAQYVLEVPSGFFDEHKLKIGNMLEILR